MTGMPNRAAASRHAVRSDAHRPSGSADNPGTRAIGCGHSAAAVNANAHTRFQFPNGIRKSVPCYSMLSALCRRVAGEERPDQDQ